MSRFFQSEKIKAGAAHFFIERAAGGEDGVTQLLGLEAAAVHAPEVAVVGINLGELIVDGRSLSIGGTGDDQLVQVLEASA